MSKKDIQRIPDYLEHIVEAIERIHLYVEDMTEVAFLEDKKTQDAVKSCAKRLTTSKVIIRIMRTHILKYLGQSCIQCVIAFHTVISRLIMN